MRVGRFLELREPSVDLVDPGSVPFDPRDLAAVQRGSERGPAGNPAFLAADREKRLAQHLVEPVEVEALADLLSDRENRVERGARFLEIIGYRCRGSTAYRLRSA